MTRKISKLGIVEFREHDMKEPTISFREVYSDLDGLQSIIGGNIEKLFLSPIFYDNKIDVIVNKERKSQNLASTLLLTSKDCKVLDVIKGNIIFASHTDNGELDSLSQEQIYFIVNNLSVGVDTKEGRILFILKI